MTPQHPARQAQAQPQQGLAQQGQGQNPYYRPNAAVANYGNEQAQVAMAQKAQAEQALMQQAEAGLGSPQPAVSPEEVQMQQQVEQVAMGLLEGQVDPQEVMARAQQGDPVAAAALQQAQAMEAQAGQQYEQEQAGLSTQAPF